MWRRVYHVSPEVYLGVRILVHELMEHDFLMSSFENIWAPLISLSTSIVPQVSSRGCASSWSPCSRTSWATVMWTSHRYLLAIAPQSKSKWTLTSFTQPRTPLNTFENGSPLPFVGGLRVVLIDYAVDAFMSIHCDNVQSHHLQHKRIMLFYKGKL